MPALEPELPAEEPMPALPAEEPEDELPPLSPPRAVADPVVSPLLGREAAEPTAWPARLSCADRTGARLIEKAAATRPMVHF